MQTRVEKLRRDGATMKQSEREKLESELMTKRDQFAEKAQKFEEDNRRRQGEERLVFRTRLRLLQLKKAMMSLSMQMQLLMQKIALTLQVRFKNRLNNRCLQFDWLTLLSS